MPLVTIIIPVYNTEKYLKQCLDSVVNQTYENLEIILINDASTDNSLSVLEDYASTYQNINLINNPTNLGVSVSRNKGLDMANGDYIYFVDSDDFIRLDTIEKMVTFAQEYDVPLVEVNYKNIKNFSSFSQKSKSNFLVTYEEIEKNKKLLQNHTGFVWNKLYCHELIKNLRFSENTLYEDNAFSYPILTQAKRCVQTTDILYFYRKNPSSTIRKNKHIPTMKILDFYESLKLIRENCINLGTYLTYKKEIDALLQNKAFNPLLESSIWFKIAKEDKTVILNNLYQFSRKQYHMPKINDIDWEYLGIPTNYCSELKKRIILYYVNEDAKDDTYENSLSPAKRILSKYKR